jgi:flagellar biosynthesis repressor protein FlbT
MALKVELKPNERIVIGTVVIRNSESRARFFIEGQAPILREKDILTADTANSPAKMIYMAVQMMYLEGTTDKHHEMYFQLVQDFVKAAPSATHLVMEVNNRILSGDFYKGLKAAKEVIAYENKILDAYRGAQGNDATGERLRPDGTTDASGS